MSSNTQQPPHHPPPTTLLQTALLSSKLQAANLDGQPASRRYPGSSASSQAGDSEDEDALVGIHTPSHGTMTPAMRSPQMGGGLSLEHQQQATIGSPGGRLKSLEGRKREPIVVKLSSDPVRAFPSEIGIKIFGQLDFRSLARCTRVSRRWSKSQTINYVWYLHHRQYKLQHAEEVEVFPGEPKTDPLALKEFPIGKWSRKESREDWRRSYRVLISSHPDSDLVPYDAVDSPYHSGTTTPRWSTPDAPSGPISKNEARADYKELKGRKSRNKNRKGAGEKGLGFAGVEEDPYGDGRFDAPF